jgi:AraC family transcriptional regulator
MKTTQRIRYAQRIEKVVRFLESSSPEATPNLAELAAIANMSEFHFHRVYRLMTGEPLGETVRRIRLARSLQALTHGAPVTAAAIDSGYSTAQAYARAMRAQTGQSPTEAQGSISDTAEQLRHAREATTCAPAAAVAVEIVSIAPFRVLAVRNTGAYEELNSTYARLFELVLSELRPENIIGIYCIQLDDPRFTPADQCRAICALDVGAHKNAAIESLEIGGHSYARLRHFGNYDLINDSIDRLYAYVLAEMDQDLSDAPQYIHYLDDPESAEESQLRSDLYLPLQDSLRENR